MCIFAMKIDDCREMNGESNGENMDGEKWMKRGRWREMQDENFMERTMEKDRCRERQMRKTLVVTFFILS
jgi:hypothetical protein